MELRHEGSATGGNKVRIQYGEESLSELTQLLAGYGAPTRGLCNRRKQGWYRSLLVEMKFLNINLTKTRVFCSMLQSLQLTDFKDNHTLL